MKMLKSKSIAFFIFLLAFSSPSFAGCDFICAQDSQVSFNDFNVNNPDCIEGGGNHLMICSNEDYPAYHKVGDIKSNGKYSYFEAQILIPVSHRDQKEELDSITFVS